MTVKQLIEQLQQFNPETPVLGTCTDPSDFNYKSPIKGIFWVTLLIVMGLIM